MAILVTGAAGFIGSSLCDELLRRNEEVIGVDNFDDFYARGIKEANLQNCCRNGKFKLYEADLADIAALDKVLRTTASIRWFIWLHEQAYAPR